MSLRIRFSSEVLVVDKGGDHVSDWQASPLGSHVADTLDGNELKTIVDFGIARDLAVCEPWSPGLLDWPVELLDPSLASVGSDCTIGVAGVEHKTGLALEHSVDPHGGLILNVITESVRALLPGLDAVWDVESCTGLSSVHVVSQEVTIDGLG